MKRLHARFQEQRTQSIKLQDMGVRKCSPECCRHHATWQQKLALEDDACDLGHWRIHVQGHLALTPWPLLATVLGVASTAPVQMACVSNRSSTFSDARPGHHAADEMEQASQGSLHHAERLRLCQPRASQSLSRS